MSKLADHSLEIITEWIHDLESGQYLQVERELAAPIFGYNGGFDVSTGEFGMCCIGVCSKGIAERHADLLPSPVKIKVAPEGILWTLDKDGYNGYGTSMPPSLWEAVAAAYLATNPSGQLSATYPTSRLQSYLIGMNDERKRDFKFIARFLRIVFGITG